MTDCRPNSPPPVPSRTPTPAAPIPVVPPEAAPSRERAPRTPERAARRAEIARAHAAMLRKERDDRWAAIRARADNSPVPVPIPFVADDWNGRRTLWVLVLPLHPRVLRGCAWVLAALLLVAAAWWLHDGGWQLVWQRIIR